MNFDERKYWILYEESAEKGFRFIYDCFHKVLIGFCMNNGQSREEAIEITQEVFCRLWAKMDSLKKDQNIQSYLFTISKHTIIDNYRLKVREKLANEHSLGYLSNQNETEKTVLHNELKNEIQETFDKMPEMRKLIFQMSRFKGRSNKEIAEEVGISIKTVEGHISKALKMFREKLGKNAPVSSVQSEGYT